MGSLKWWLNITGVGNEYEDYQLMVCSYYIGLRIRKILSGLVFGRAGIDYLIQTTDVVISLMAKTSY